MSYERTGILPKLYFTPTIGSFQASIKTCAEDFVVREIQSNGITSDIKTKTKPETKESNVDVATKFQNIDESLRIKLGDFYKSDEDILVVESPQDKSMRKLIHEFVRTEYKGKLDSVTKPGDGEGVSFISISKGKNPNSSYRHNPSKRPDGKYLHFNLKKTNLDTAEACQYLAKATRVPAKIFLFSGNKDRRAVTYQRLSVRNMIAEKLIGARLPESIEIGDYKYEDFPLALGSLNGNRFEITLRNIEPFDKDALQNVFNKWNSEGFINYFGAQRFGSTEISTPKVGLAVLKNDWQKVIDLILAPRNDKNQEMFEARKEWAESRNAEQALSKLRNRRSIEALLLSSIAKCHENDFAGPFGSLPRNTRLLYVHSFQSYIWNKAVSYRFEKLGSGVLKGDLVYAKPVENNAKRQKLDPNDSTPEVKVLTAEDCMNYSIKDVVLPLPGTQTILPDNAVGEYLKEAMAEYDINLLEENKTKIYTLPGGYRKVIETVQNAEIEFDTESNSVVLKFSLNSSVYATVALREFLRSETAEDISDGDDSDPIENEVINE